MSRSLIRKTQLHPDINDLVGQYGSGYFTNSIFTVNMTGSQIISGVKTFRNLKIGPPESSLGQSIDITYYNNNFRLISNTTQNSTIIDSAIVRGSGDPGGNASFWAYRFNADPNNERVILQLNNADAYEDNGNYPNSFQFFDISVLGTGNEYFYLDSQSGVMRLTRRPTVNGTGVLLEGESVNFTNDRVWTTGISAGNSSYTIPYIRGAFSSTPTVLVTLDVTGSTVFNYNIKNRTTSQFTLLFPSNLTENITLNIRATV
jgi:hypothetical protein